VGGWYVSPCLAKSLCFFIAKQYIPWYRYTILYSLTEGMWVMSSF
jgi:hypothetical protein